MRAAVLLLFFLAFSAFADSRLDAALALLNLAGGKKLWVVAALYDDTYLRAAVLRDTPRGFRPVAVSDDVEPVMSEPSIYSTDLELDLIPYPSLRTSWRSAPASATP